MSSTEETIASGAITILDGLRDGFEGSGSGGGGSESEITALKTRMTAAESNIESLESDVTTLESSVSGLTSDIDSVESAIQDIQDDVSSLTSRLSTIEGDYVTSSDLATALASYVTTSALSTALGDYYTSAQVQSYVQNVVSALDLGSNVYYETSAPTSSDGEDGDLWVYTSTTPVLRTGGYSYFDTGIVLDVTNGWEMKYKFSPIDKYNYCYFCGDYYSGLFMPAYYGNFIIRNGGNEISYSTGMPASIIPGKTIIEVDHTSSNLYIDVDGVRRISFSNSDSTTHINNVLINRGNWSTASGGESPIARYNSNIIYYVQIYNNGNLVFDGVPYKASTTLGHLYDNVSESVISDNMYASTYEELVNNSVYYKENGSWTEVGDMG